MTTWGELVIVFRSKDGELPDSLKEILNESWCSITSQYLLEDSDYFRDKSSYLNVRAKLLNLSGSRKRKYLKKMQGVDLYRLIASTGTFSQAKSLSDAVKVKKISGVFEVHASEAVFDIIRVEGDFSGF